MEEIKCTREDIEVAAQWVYRFFMLYDMTEKGMTTDERAGLYYEMETEKLPEIQKNLLNIMMEGMTKDMENLSGLDLRKREHDHSFWDDISAD